MRWLGAGHTGFPIYGISKCRDIGDSPCSFPFAIVAFDPKTLKDQVLFEAPTGSIPGASVAALRKETESRTAPWSESELKTLESTPAVAATSAPATPPVAEVKK